MPNVGRLEMIVKPMPASRSRRTACFAAVGQYLVRGHQRAVDIGDNKGDAGHGRFLLSACQRDAAELTDDVIDDGLDRRIDRDGDGIFVCAAGGSSVRTGCPAGPAA